MKARLITSFFGLIVLAVVLFCFNIPFVMELVAGVLSAISVYELLHATRFASRKRLYFAAMGFALLLPYFFALGDLRWPLLLFVAFLVYLLCNGVFGHKQITFLQVVATAFMGTVVSLCYCSLLLYRDLLAPYGLFYTMLSCGGAWLCDTGAFFSGLALGKHKLAPEISPKKTIEGAIGGVITAALGFLLVGFLYQTINNAIWPQTPIYVNYLYLGLTGLLLAPVGIVGDLSASVIKRQTDLKDFGTVMPGHGGVMDRFDSYLWTTGCLAMLTIFFQDYLFV